MPKKKSLEILKYNKKIKNRLNVNLNNYKKEDYIHIYFNDNKEEIKRNYLEKNEKVTKIKILIDYQIKSFEHLFEYCKCIEYINFKKIYRKNINNINNMFLKCFSLKKIDFSNFNTDNVTDMGFMFYGCSSLKELNLSNFNTNNVTNMYCLFYGCSSLKVLNLTILKIRNEDN